MCLSYEEKHVPVFTQFTENNIFEYSLKMNVQVWDHDHDTILHACFLLAKVYVCTIICFSEFLFHGRLVSHTFKALCDLRAKIRLLQNHANTFVKVPFCLQSESV